MPEERAKVDLRLDEEDETILDKVWADVAEEIS